MKLLNPFKRRLNKREEQLLKLYEEGKYLRVNQNIDNKKLMLEGENGHKPSPENTD